MLPKRMRLRRSIDILNVMRSGKLLSTGTIRLYLKPSSHATTRSACVVGKKVSRLATKRHHYQRWLRVIAQETAHLLPNTYDMVLVAQPRIVNIKSLDELRLSIMSHVRKLL